MRQLKNPKALHGFALACLLLFAAIAAKAQQPDAAAVPSGSSMRQCRRVSKMSLDLQTPSITWSTAGRMKHIPWLR